MSVIDPHENAAEAFARLAIELHAVPGLENTVGAVLTFALQALNCDEAGVAIAARNGLEIVATTSEMIETLYQRQLEDGEGPLFDATRDQVMISVADVAFDSRWPLWAARVHAAGLGSVLHIPMLTRAHTVGVLSMYAIKPHAFNAEDEAIAHLLAQHASVAVADARREETMAEAVDARRLVGQAMGILMERFNVSDDRAFAILRRYSQDTNTKLHDVAQALIDTRKLPME